MTNNSTENITTDIIDRNRTISLPASFPTEYKSEFFMPDKTFHRVRYYD